MRKTKMAAALFAAILAAGCSNEWKPIPGTTTRVSEPQNAEGQELKLRIFTDMEDCSGTQPRFIDEEEKMLCLPHVLYDKCARCGPSVWVATQNRAAWLRWQVGELTSNSRRSIVAVVQRHGPTPTA